MISTKQDSNVTNEKLWRLMFNCVRSGKFIIKTLDDSCYISCVCHGSWLLVRCDVGRHRFSCWYPRNFRNQYLKNLWCDLGLIAVAMMHSFLVFPHILCLRIFPYITFIFLCFILNITDIVTTATYLNFFYNFISTCVYDVTGYLNQCSYVYSWPNVGKVRSYDDSLFEKYCAYYRI